MSFGSFAEPPVSEYSALTSYFGHAGSPMLVRLWNARGTSRLSAATIETVFPMP
jgi:hypothetical protein